MVHRIRRLALGAAAGVKARLGSEQGAVAMIAAVFMFVSVGFAGLVVDVGNARQVRREAQAAADAAALAGAQELLNASWTWSGIIQQVQTYAANDDAIPVAAWTGCADPKALAYSPDAGARDSCISADSATSPSQLRVTLPDRNVSTFFGRALGVSTIRVDAAAGSGVATGAPCVLCVLSPTAAPALSGNGNSTLAINGGGIVVDSTGNPAAAILIGNATMAATFISGPAAPAHFQTTGNAVYSPAPVQAAPVPDPFASVPECPAAGATCPTTSTADVHANSNATAVLTPGIYGNISASGNGSLTFNPGTYIITGGLSMTGNGNFTATGVTLYFACSSYPTPCSSGQSGATLTLAGNGNTTMSPPTSGPFQGMAIFFDRNNASSPSISGNGAATAASGTVYMKSANLTLNGNGSTVNMMMVANTVSAVGNGNLTINYTAAGNAPVRRIMLSQ